MKAKTRSLWISMFLSLPFGFTLLYPEFSASQITFERCYGDIAADGAYAVRETMDGGYVVVGYHKSGPGAKNDAWLFKTDENGILQWSKVYGGIEEEEALSVEQVGDGGYIVAGWTMSYGAGNRDAFIIRTTANGDTLWTKTYGGTDKDEIRSIKVTNSGGFVAAGFTRSFGAGNIHDGWLLMLRADGTLEWQKTFGDPIFGDLLNDVQQTTDGGYMLTGWWHAFNPWLIKTDANGNVVWSKTFTPGAIGLGESHSVQPTIDGGYIITGYSGAYPDRDIFLIKTNSSGDSTLWTKYYGESGIDEGASSIAQTNDGGFIVAGYRNSGMFTDPNVYLVKTNAEGDSLWTRTFGGDANDEAFSVQQTIDGGYIVAGFSGSGFAKNGDAYLIKTKSDGVVGVAVTDLGEFPKYFELHQNYPNPFNMITTITYQLPKTSNVSIKIYNQTGQLVKTLLEKAQTRGYYSVQWDGTDDYERYVASGIYFYRLETENFIQVKKALLLK